MMNEKEQSLKNNIVIIICFFFVSTQEKYLRNIAEFLRRHEITLHRNTKQMKNMLLKNKLQDLNFSSQANYIGIGLQNINEEQHKNLLVFFSKKNIKCMSFATFYKQKLSRPKMLLGNTEKK